MLSVVKMLIAVLLWLLLNISQLRSLPVLVTTIARSSHGGFALSPINMMCSAKSPAPPRSCAIVITICGKIPMHVKIERILKVCNAPVLCFPLGDCLYRVAALVNLDCCASIGWLSASAARYKGI